MSGGKKRSVFEITSVTSDFNQTPAGQPGPLSGLSVIQSAISSSYTPQGSSSQPTTPSLKRKYISHDALGKGAGSSTRFRVVRLAVGGEDSGVPGQPYRRGRWKCTDFVESWEDVGFRRVSNTMRQAHSLESLEMIGRDTYKGRTHLPAQPIRGRDSPELALRSESPSPTLLREPINLKFLECKKPMAAQDSTLPVPQSLPVLQSPRPRSVHSPLRFDANTRGESVLGLSQAQPRPPSIGPCHPSLFPIQTAAAFSLDQNIFNLPGEPSSPSNSLIAIDNKIEQAMDLVKSHLMLAVREEVELLREQIRKLQDKNQQLERENLILRTLTHSITHTTQTLHNTHNTHST